jgi:hypothetical protein
MILGRRHLPIVIGGAHRSGTSLLRRLLNAHPRIYCGPEVKCFRDLYGHYKEDQLAHLRFSHSARAITPEAELLQAWGGMYIRLLRGAARRAKKARWADKNPENAVYLPQWEQLLGQRWIYVHVIRNPLDVLASIDEAGFPHTLPADLPGRIEFVRRYMELGLDYVERYPKRACLAVYEQLVSEPAATLSSLMHFLGETCVSEQLDFAAQEHDAGLEDPKVEKTGGIHQHSLAHWKKCMDSKTANTIWRATGPLWQRVDPHGQWFAGPDTGIPDANSGLP